MSRSDELIEKYLEGIVTPGESDDLAMALKADDQRLREFLASYELEQLLRTIHTPVKAGTIEAILAQLHRESDPFVESVAQRIQRPGNLRGASPRSLLPAHPSVRERIARWLASRRYTWLGAGVIAATVLLAMLFSAFTRPLGTPAIARLDGDGVTIQRGAGIFAATVGMKLLPSDRLRVATNASVLLTFAPEDTRLELTNACELKFIAFAGGKHFELRAGHLDAAVARQRPFRPMRITTLQAEAQILGTRFTLTATTNATQLDVTEGKVRFTRASGGSSVLVTTGNGALASKDVELTVQPLTRGILREYWTNVPGLAVITLTSHSNFPDHPHGRDQLDKLEARSQLGQNYGERLRGYLHPPTTGEYTFWIATGDGHADLLLSPDDKPENRRQIAMSISPGPRGWDRDGQQSAAIPLVAGRKYYLEALHKQNAGNEYFAVAWQAPGGEREVIPGRYLSPFKPKK